MYTEDRDRLPAFQGRQARALDEALQGVVERVTKTFDYAISGLGKRTKQQIVPELQIKMMRSIHDRIEAAALAAGQHDDPVVVLLLSCYRDEIDDMCLKRVRDAEKLERTKLLYKKNPFGKNV